MPRCYFLIGPPACGKSTWRETMLPRLNNPVVISTDDLIEDYCAEHGMTYDEAFYQVDHDAFLKKAIGALVRAVIEGSDIVIDRTNTSVASRAQFRRYLPPKYEKVAVDFEFDVADLLERSAARFRATGKFVPPSVIEQKAGEYTKPLDGEFDEVIVVPITRPQSAP